MNGRGVWPCWRCEEVKPPDGYPMGRSGKRHSSVCWACTETEAYTRMEKALAYRATWVDPETGRVVRRCADCHEVKDLEREFYKTVPALPGSRYGRNQPCKVCQDARKRAWEKAHPEHVRERSRRGAKRYAQRHPDRIKARTKAAWEATKADPVRHAKVMEDARINRRLRNERKGKVPRGKAPPSRVSQPTGVNFVPSAPLAALVTRLIDERKALDIVMGGEGRGVVGDVCRDLGIPDRRYRSWLKGEHPTARIGVAEKVLLNAGVEWHEVYSYDDHAAAFLPVQTPA